MHTFAQKSAQPQTQSSLNFARARLGNYAAFNQTGPSLQLQTTIEHRMGKPAVKAESDSDSAAPATSALGHDFSRIPIHAPGPTTVSDGATAPGAESTSPGDCPPGKAWVAGQHLAPIFVPKVKTHRSNTSASITVPDKVPEVPGHVAIDCKNKGWRYQLDQFVSTVNIDIYYFTEDHYPAPKPRQVGPNGEADDDGELTNVTKYICKAMVEDLHRNKDKVHDKWSAYRRDHLHEDYHYKVEWMGAMNKFVPRFESAVEKLIVPFTMAKTEAEAEKILEPAVKTGHDAGYAKEGHAWEKIPDVTGAGAYIAQVPAIEYIIGRVLKYAKGRKWLPAGYTPGQGALQADPQKKGEQKGKKADPRPEK